jgi:hypothetical protein
MDGTYLAYRGSFATAVGRIDILPERFFLA